MLIILSLCFLAQISFGQKAKQWVAMGDESWAKNDWYAAQIYYEKAFLLDSTNFRNTVKYAESFRKTKDYQQAAYYYDKLYRKDRGKIFPKGLFWLASMQKYNGDYQESLRNFKKYNKKQRKNKKGYLYLKSKQEIASCKWAINVRKDSGAVAVTNIQAPVNTSDSEFGASVYDSVFYYSSMKSVISHLPIPGKVKVFETEYDSIFAKPKEWNYNSEDFHQANISFSKDGKTAYFSRCDSLNGCKIFKANVNENQWNDIQSLDQVNQSETNNTMPNLATINGKEVLFFVSNRAGGKGKMDIWWSVKKDGEFQNPMNAGDKINSIDDEITPFYLDGKLYFSSNWHEGFGGFDIFESKGNPAAAIPQLFQEPKNLGYPINSSVNDMYYSYFTTINQGFLTSNRDGSITDGKATCCNDIWAISYIDSTQAEEIDTLAYQTLAELNKYLPVTLYFHNDEPNPRTLDTTTMLSYMDAFDSYLALEEKYGRENSKGLAGEKKEEALFDVEDFFDFYVRKGVQDLEIFSVLLLKELQEGAAITLSVRGFASPLAESDYNVNLTKRRINSLVNYLKKYQGGVFLPYFNATSTDGGRLKIKEIPFGEFQASDTVSDASTNKKESIYSRGARLERKIEIMSVERIPEDSVYSRLELLEEVFNFGIIQPDEVVNHTFDIVNTGNKVLVIDSVEVSCGCTTSMISKTILAPNEEAQLEIQFDPKGQTGLLKKEIFIYTNESEEPRVIVITSEVD